MEINSNQSINHRNTRPAIYYRLTSEMLHGRQFSRVLHRVTLAKYCPFFMCRVLYHDHLILKTFSNNIEFISTYSQTFILIVITVKPFMPYVVSQMANYHRLHHMPSGKRHEILNLSPSVFVFRPHLNQLEHSASEQTHDLRAIASRPK